MRLRTAVLRQVFKVQNVNGMFSDAISNYAASKTAITATACTRVGQIMIGSSGGTWLAYQGIAVGSTGATGWVAMTIT